MNKDVISSIAIAIVGVVLSFFLCNLIVGDSIKEETVKTVDSSFSVDLAEPSAEVFNYKAINPTVEVYVGDRGDCRETDSDGKCLDDNSNSDNDNQDNS